MDVLVAGNAAIGRLDAILDRPDQLLARDLLFGVELQEGTDEVTTHDGLRSMCETRISGPGSKKKRGGHPRPGAAVQLPRSIHPERVDPQRATPVTPRATPSRRGQAVRSCEADASGRRSVCVCAGRQRSGSHRVPAASGRTRARGRRCRCPRAVASDRPSSAHRPSSSTVAARPGARTPAQFGTGHGDRPRTGPARWSPARTMAPRLGSASGTASS